MSESKQEYMQLDTEYLNTKCRKRGDCTLYQKTIPSHHISTRADYLADLLKMHSNDI